MKPKAMLLMLRKALGVAPGIVALELDKAAHAKLPEVVRSMYVDRDGKYVLDADIEDVSGLKSALDAERRARREADRKVKELAQRFEGIDPEKVREMLSKLGNDEEAALLRAGKVDEVVERRVRKAIEAAEAKANDANTRVQRYAAFVLDNQVRAACAKAGVHANAVDDALLRARSIFKLDDDGNAVKLDADGKPEYSKDGKTPFGPSEWIEGMKATAPHWFPAGSAGGGSQGGGKKSGASTITRADFSKMSPEQQRATALDKSVTIVD